MKEQTLEIGMRRSSERESKLLFKPVVVCLTTAMVLSNSPSVVGFLLSTMIFSSLVFGVSCILLSLGLRSSPSEKSRIWALLDKNRRSNSITRKAIAFYILCFKRFVNGAILMFAPSRATLQSSTNNLLHVAKPKQSAPAPLNVSDIASTTSHGASESPPAASIARRGPTLRRPTRQFQSDDDDMTGASPVSFRPPSRVKILSTSRMDDKTQEKSNDQSTHTETTMQAVESLEKLRRQLDESTKERDNLLNLLEQERLEKENAIKSNEELAQPQGESDIARIDECRNVTAALQIKQQKIQRLEISNGEAAKQLEDERRRRSVLEKKMLTIETNANTSKLLQIEKEKNRQLAEMQEQTHQIMESTVPLEDIFAGRLFSHDLEESWAQKLELMENHLQNVAKSTSSTRLRVIKSQKLLTLERERSLGLEDELNRMDRLVSEESEKTHQNQQEVYQLTERLTSKNKESRNLLSEKDETQVLLEAEKGKKVDLINLMEQKESDVRDRMHGESLRAQTLELTHGNLVEQLKCLESQLVEKDANTASIESKFKALQKSAAEATQHVKTQNAQHDDLRSENTRLLGQMVRLESNSAEKQEEMSVVNKRVNELLSDSEKQREDIESLHMEITQKEEAAQASSKISSEFQNIIILLKQQLGEQQSKEVEVLASKKELVEMIESLEQTIKEKESANSELNGALRKQRSEYLDAESRLETLETIHSDFKNTSTGEIVDLATKMESLNKDLIELRSEMASLEQHRASSNHEIKKLKSELLEDKLQSEVLRSEREQLNLKVKNFEEQIQDQKSRSSECNAEIQTIKDELSTTTVLAEQNEARLVQEKADLNQKIQDLNNGLQADQKRLETMIEDSAKNKSTLESERLHFRNQVEALNKQIVDETTLRGSVQDRLQTLIEDSERHTADQAEGTAELQRRLEHKESLLAYEKETLETLEELYGELQADFAMAQARIENFEEENDKLSEEVQTMGDEKCHQRSLLDEGSTKLSSLEEDRQKLNVSLVDEQASKKELEGERDQLLQNLEHARSIVKTLELTIDTRDVLLVEEKSKLAESAEKLKKLQDEQTELNALIKLVNEKFEAEQTRTLSLLEEERMKNAHLQCHSTEHRLLLEAEQLVHDSSRQRLQYACLLMELKDQVLSTLETKAIMLKKLEEKHASTSKKFECSKQMISQLEADIRDCRTKLELEAATAEVLHQDLEKAKREADFEGSKTKSLLKAGSRRLEELEKNLESEQKRTKNLEMEHGRNKIMLESQQNTLRDLEHSEEQATAALNREKHQMEELTCLNQAVAADLESEQAKVVLASKESNAKSSAIADLQKRVSCFESIRSELVRVGLGLKQRDMLLVAIMGALGKRRAKASKESVEKLRVFVDDFSKKTGLSFSETQSFDKRSEKSLLAFENPNIRRLGLGLGLTLPLVPLVAMVQSGSRDSAILIEPILAMLGFY